MKAAHHVACDAEHTSISCVATCELITGFGGLSGRPLASMFLSTSIGIEGYKKETSVQIKKKLFVIGQHHYIVLFGEELSLLKFS